MNATAGAGLQDSELVDARILVAHEWVSETGGSERVFLECLRALGSPDAVCLWNDNASAFPRQPRETFLAQTPFRRSKALALPLMPMAWRSLDIAAYSHILTSSHAFAHHLAGRAARNGLSSFAYIHTPARYLWAPEVEDRGKSLLARSVGPMLRGIDRRAVNAGVSYAANSYYIRDRIARAWGVDASVIYPPVDVELIQGVTTWSHTLPEAEGRVLAGLPAGDFLLGASRLVPYKRLDAVIRLGSALGLPVVIAGGGPDLTRLREVARESKSPVTFLGRVSTPMLYALYQRASLYAFLGQEDFGIMPVECIAAGTPVLVNVIGGAKESVEATGGGGSTEVDAGMRHQVDAASAAMDADMGTARQRSKAFSSQSFRQSIRAWIADSNNAPA